MPWYTSRLCPRNHRRHFGLHLREESKPRGHTKHFYRNHRCPFSGHGNLCSAGQSPSRFRHYRILRPRFGFVIFSLPDQLILERQPRDRTTARQPPTGGRQGRTDSPCWPRSSRWFDSYQPPEPAQAGWEISDGFSYASALIFLMITAWRRCGTACLRSDPAERGVGTCPGSKGSGGG